MAHADVMATSMLSKAVASFWKNVSKTYNKVMPIATTVNGVSNPSSISTMWKVNFESLLNSVNSYVNMQHVKEYKIQEIFYNDYYTHNTLHGAECNKQTEVW